MPDDNSSSHHFPADDLDWLAFCYIADELPSGQRDEFELRLATDQHAREAVGQAWEESQLLFAALKSGEPILQPSIKTDLNCDRRGKTRRYWSQRRRNLRAIFAAAGAAVLLVAAGWSWFVLGGFYSEGLPSLAKSALPPVPSLNTTRNGTALAIDPDQLAFAWAMTLNEFDINSNFEAMDAVDGGYTNVLFTEDLWIMDAILDLEEAPTNEAEPKDFESDDDDIDGSEKSSPSVRLGDFQ